MKVAVTWIYGTALTVDSFEVFRKELPSTSYVLVGSVLNEARLFEDLTVVNGHSYQYAVYAKKAGVLSLTAAETTVVLVNPPAPQAPQSAQAFVQTT